MPTKGIRGGIGLKSLKVWNKAWIAKVVWKSPERNIHYGFTGCMGNTLLAKTGGTTDSCMTYVCTRQSFARSKRNSNGEALRGKNGSRRTTPMADTL